MKTLVVGAGVIGTVYGAQLGAAGHTVSVLAHGGRTDEVARDGLRARDVLADVVTDSPAAVLDRSDPETFDLVLVALRRDHLPSAADQLAKLSGRPLVPFFGNNPDGRAGLPADVPGAVLIALVKPLTLGHTPLVSISARRSSCRPDHRGCGAGSRGPCAPGGLWPNSPLVGGVGNLTHFHALP